MFILDASKSNLTVRQRELMTSGSVNVNTIKFEFSADWDGLTRTAVFRNDAENRSILLDGTNQCEIPREVLSSAGQRVYAGVYGTRGQETVLPTIWASLGVVLAGAAPDGGTYPPTPELWEQELAKKQDKLHGEPGQLVGFDESGNAVAQDAGEAMQGPPGPQGVPGKDGKSAYQIAVDGGFEGTEEEWLESLQGPPGKDGAPGPAGLPGAAGAEGPPGSSGTTFTPSVSSDGVLSWTNDGNLPNPEPVNINGPAGANGADGTDGENGVGVPPGGAAGQILSKKTAADYDTQWIDAPQSGGTEITAGDGLTITGGVASVDTPVKSILTQAEYDALPEAEQNKGMYVISDGGSGGSSGGGSSESLDVYSTEEKRIGTWIDKKPLYRFVYRGTTPGSVNTFVNTVTIPDLDTFVRAWATNLFSMGNFNMWHSPPKHLEISVEQNTKQVKVNITNNSALNKPFFMTVEYTKTTDEPEVTA